MKSVKKLSDRELVLAAQSIKAEAKLRANRKAAAAAILAILKKHKLSKDDLLSLDLVQRSSKTNKKSRSLSKPSVAKVKANPKANPQKTTQTDKRTKVAFKYKNPKGNEKWSGRGRAPKWVTEILLKKRISLKHFKAHKRY